MIVFLLSVALWLIVAVMALLAYRRGPHVLGFGLKAGTLDFLQLLPRLAIGVVGSGFLAELLPADLVRDWLGPDSGLTGLLLATLAGTLTPGGPVVGFAIGSSALKSGAGFAAVVAYVVAWSLFALQRLVVWEIPVMPQKVVWLRVVVSLPLPFLAAWGVMLLGAR